MRGRRRDADQRQPAGRRYSMNARVEDDQHQVEQHRRQPAREQLRDLVVELTRGRPGRRRAREEERRPASRSDVPQEAGWTSLTRELRHQLAAGSCAASAVSSARSSAVSAMPSSSAGSQSRLTADEDLVDEHHAEDGHDQPRQHQQQAASAMKQHAPAEPRQPPQQRRQRLGPRPGRPELAVGSNVSTTPVKACVELLVA